MMTGAGDGTTGTAVTATGGTTDTMAATTDITAVIAAATGITVADMAIAGCSPLCSRISAAQPARAAGYRVASTTDTTTHSGTSASLRAVMRRASGTTESWTRPSKT